MPVWAPRIPRARWLLSFVSLLAALAHGAGRPASAVTPPRPPEPPPAPHPLVIATETLYQRNLHRACDELMKLTAMAPGITDEDAVRLQFITALRAIDDSNEVGARRALSQALQIDRSAEPLPFAIGRLRTRLDETRAQFPPTPPPRADARLAAARKAASAREPAARALLRAIDALYLTLEIEGAIVVLEQARALTPLSAGDRVQLSLRQGILTMEFAADEAGASAAFREALKVEPNASLPDLAPPKTRAIFEDVRHALRTAAASEAAATAAARPPVNPKVPAATATPAFSVEELLTKGSRQWGLVAGSSGLAFVAGGAVAGAIALSAYEAEKTASTSGDWDGYVRNRDTAGAAVVTANVLYGVGAVALGVGAFLYLRASDGIKVAPGVGPGRVSLTVGGNF